MTTRDSFPYLIEYIFGEIEQASYIRIDCTEVEDNTISTMYTSIRVVAVNGMDSPGCICNNSSI